VSTAYSVSMPSPSSSAVGTRQRNLARVLRLVHEEGPVPRSALTERTGLNRSTTAALVGELADLGLVSEQLPDAAGRVGRPSPVVGASADVVALVANPEVDAVEIAAIGLDRSVRLRERVELAGVPTPDEAVATIAERAAAWSSGALAGARIVAAGLAVPGLVRAADGVVRNAPHLGWRDVGLADLASEALGVPAVADNDATCGIVAEHRFGAARGRDHVVYLNGGASGIGGGLIVHGVPVGGASGFAGEFGQSRDGGASLETRVRRQRLLDAAGLAGGDDAALRDALARAAAESDDGVADELAAQRSALAGALANAVDILNPGLIVLGGFLAIVNELGEGALAAEVAAAAMPESAEGLAIAQAALGADRLLIGAAEAAFASLLDDPAAGGGA